MGRGWGKGGRELGRLVEVEGEGDEVEWASSVPVVKPAHTRPERLERLAVNSTSMEPVPLVDSAREKSIILVSVLFADRHVPVRMCAPENTLSWDQLI